MRSLRAIKLVSRVATPRWVHRFVHELVTKLTLSSEPRFVPVIPAKGASKSECFYNVPDHIAEHGGGCQFGWAIWQVANLFVEAEFHCVWVSPEGEWVDVTPKADEETRILFVPDPVRKWERRRVFNIRHPITDCPELQAFLAKCEEVDALMRDNASPVDPHEFTVSPDVWNRVNQEKARCATKLIPLVLPESSRCCCESGRNFKNCCGKL